MATSPNLSRTTNGALIGLQTTPGISTAEYIEALFVPDDLICIMTLRDGEKPKHIFTTAKEAASSKFIASLHKQNEVGHNIYICMNPLTAKRRIKDNVSCIRTLYLDIDKNGVAALEKISQSTLVPQPHFILQSSPNKFYVIWGVTNIQSVEQERILDALIQEFGGDPAASDCTRVLRLPGFMNHKYPEKPVVTILESTFDGGEYTAADFHVKIAPFKIAEQTPTTIKEGNRHTRLVSLAGKLRREGFNEPEILAALQAANTRCTIPLPDAEVAGIAASIVTQYAPAKTVEDPKTQAPQTESLLVSRKANSITPKEIKWLWQDKIPLGKLTLFSGNPDNGKSIVSVSLAAIASTKQTFPGCHFSHEPADVLMLVGEDDLDDTVVPRLMAAGADMDRIDFPEAVLPVQAVSREIRLDFDVPAIERKLAANPNIRLVTIDPISNYLGAVPMSADQDVRSMILMPLKRLAEKYNIAVVIVMHLNKKSDLDAINRVGGAMAFIAVCRVAWLFARNVEDSTEGEDVSVPENTPDTFSMLCIKNNIAKAYHTGLSYSVQVRGVRIDGKSILEPYVVWGHAIKGSADDALKTIKQKSHASAAHVGSRPHTKMQEATNWLTDALQDGEPHPNGPLTLEAKERDNIKPDTLKEAYRRMVDAGVAKRAWKVGSVYVWKLVPMHAGSEDSRVPQQSELIDAGGAA